MDRTSASASLDIEERRALTGVAPALHTLNAPQRSEIMGRCQTIGITQLCVQLCARARVLREGEGGYRLLD